jgi:hypothetical protein
MADKSTDDLYDLISQADPETLQAMIDAGLVPERSNIAQGQYNYGQKLAGTPSAQGREVGKTYVASSPLEHLAVALRNYQGQKMMKDAQSQQQGLLDRQGQGRLDYLRLIAGRGQPSPGPQIASPQMIDGDLPQE